MNDRAREKAADTLHGKGALLTGAGGGLGEAFAQVLAARGVRLFLSSRDPSVLAKRCGEVETLIAGAEVYGHPFDLRRDDHVDALASAAVEALGGVDILVNNAGVFPVVALAGTTDEIFDECWTVNVRAPFRLCRALAPAMAERGWGRILNVASSSAYAGFRDTTAYCASKHALLGLSRALSNELKERNVRVSCIAPGSIDTPMGRKLRHQDPSTFLDAHEVARFAVDLLAQDGNMVVEEVRLSRMRLC